MSTAIEATYRVVTPLFCAGADPRGAELRLPSFKGVLRYWWRALAWSRFAGDLDAIRRQEDELFGSAGGGQSRVLMRLAPASDLPVVTTIGTVLTVAQGNSRVVGEGARYLGYGVMQPFRSRNTEAGQLTRACLHAPFDFTVKLRCRELDGEAVTLLKDALKTVGLLGGMGARSRKGYGSLVLRSLCVDGVGRWSPPGSLRELQETIGALHSGNGPAGLPEITALSGETRHVLITSNKNEPVDLLDLMGRELVRYRSWGRRGKILGGSIDSEKRFEDDHDLMKSCNRRSHPRRIAFGLPHNYGGPDGQVGPFAKGLDRRASPLFIHIHEGGETPVAVLSFLPARFLPQGRSDISVGKEKIPQTSESTLYEPVRKFLDRLLDPGQRKEPFTDAVEVGS